MRWLPLGLLLVAPAVRGGVVWDESADGDFSDDRLAPTAVSVSLGGNELLGTTVRNDLDYVTFTVPEGGELSALWLRHYASEDPVAFIAVQAGSVFTEPNVGVNPANLLGWLHVGEEHLGQDVLPAIGQGDGAAGFAPPLPAGDYTLWIQQTGTALTEYAFDAQIAAVPEPGGLELFALAVGAALGPLRFGGRARRAFGRSAYPPRCAHATQTDA